MLQLISNILLEIASYSLTAWVREFLIAQSAGALVVLAISFVLAVRWWLGFFDAKHGFVHTALPADWIVLKSTPRITAKVKDWLFEKNIRVMRCNQGFAIAVARGCKHRFMLMPGEDLQITYAPRICRISDSSSQSVLVSRSDLSEVDL